VLVVPARVVNQVKVPVAQLLVMLIALPVQIGVELNVGKAGIGFTTWVTLATVLAQPVVASIHFAKYEVLTDKFPVGAVVLEVPAKVVNQVKVPVAQILVMIIGLPAQIGVELNIGKAGIGLTVWIIVATVLAQPVAASIHFAKYEVLADTFPVGAVVLVVPARVVNQVKVPDVQLLVIFTALPEQTGVELNVGKAGMGFTTWVTVATVLAQPVVASTHFAKYEVLAVKFPVGAVVDVVPAKVVNQVKAPDAQLLVMLAWLPEQIGVELNVGKAGIGFTTWVTVATVLAQPVVASTHFAKYEVLTDKFPVGAVVAVVPAKVVNQVKVPVAQLLVMFAWLPEQIGVELNVGKAGIGFTTWVTVATALAQPVVASTHFAKYEVLAVKFPLGADVAVVPARVVNQVKVPVAQLLVMITALPEQIGVELNIGKAGIGFTTWVTVATVLAQPEVASIHFAKYEVLADKLPVGAVVAVVPAKVVNQVKVPVAQLLVIFIALPAQIGVELNIGKAGIGLTTWITVATVLAQPVVASIHFAKYEVLADKLPVGAVVVVVPAKVVNQVKVPVAQLLVIFIALPEQIGVELNIGKAGIGFTTCVTLATVLAHELVASTHFAKYEVFAVKFPVGAVVAVVAARVVNQVKVPVAQLLVMLIALPEQIGVELNIGKAGIGLTTWVTVATVLAQPVVASTHFAKYEVLTDTFPVGAVVLVVPARVVNQVKVPVAQLLVMLAWLPEQIGVELNVGKAGIGFTSWVTVATVLAQPVVASTHFAK
jgi:hypothetical protein